MNSQNYNRYSYCLNNPLKYTDPSGQQYYYNWYTQQYEDENGNSANWWFVHDWMNSNLSHTYYDFSTLSGAYTHIALGRNSSGWFLMGAVGGNITGIESTGDLITNINITNNGIGAVIYGTAHWGLQNNVMNSTAGLDYIQNYGERIFGQNSTDGFDMGRSRHLGPGIDNGGYWHVDAWPALYNWLRSKFASSSSSNSVTPTVPYVVDSAIVDATTIVKELGPGMFSNTTMVLYKNSRYEQAILRTNETYKLGDTLDFTVERAWSDGVTDSITRYIK